MNRMDLNSKHSCDFSYHNITRSQISIDKYNGESKRINIPEKISGQEVVEIGEKAFSNNLIIEHIQLPDSILRINDFAFFGCRNLRKVKFGLGIRKIGDNAFAECESLQDIQIRSKMDCIGANAFSLSSIESVEINTIEDLREESFSLCSRLTSFSVKKVDRIPENCFLHDIYLSSVKMECKTEVADSAFADCRRLSDIEYGQWDFSDTEDIYISDAPMRKMRRPFFRIKVILKNEPRLESEIVMEKAKRLYEYIAEHSDLQKEISNILPDDIISNILNGSLPVFPHEDLGIIVDENELIHYMNHAVLYKEVGDGQYISIKGKLYLFSNKIGFYGGSDRYEILLDDIAAIMEFEGSPIILEVLTNGENLYISTPNTEVLFKVLHTIESSKSEDDMKYMKIETTIEKIIEGADLDSYIFYFEDVQHSQINEDMEKQIGILIEKLHKLNTALEKYPDKVEGTHRFSNYYLPETLRLIFAHQQYLTAGVSKEQIDKVYTKVMESIDTVIAAVERKIDSIYQVATMDTIAKANALQKIMGQDGYVKGEGPLKH